MPLSFRVGCVVVDAAAADRSPDRDAVADGDIFWSDVDVLNQQSQHPPAQRPGDWPPSI